MYPGGTETCDGLDNDCDTMADNDAVDAVTWYADVDRDAFGDPANTEAACSAPAGYVSDSTDCDDSRSDVNPGETELCDGSDVDEDCNGLVNDADPGMDPSGRSHLYHDADGDAYGDPATDTLYCSSPDSSWIGDSTDCDDGNAGVNPSATEACNGLDDDCDGTVDNGAIDAATWYRDADRDGHGDLAITQLSCSEPSGYTASSDDCDDTNSDSYPGDVEWCDGVDNDCSGAVDDGDSDADGYEVCDDCDDGDASLNPGEAEVCDGADNDCDGLVDIGATDAIVSYLDDDNDGYGDPASPVEDCTTPSGYVLDDTDCDDARDWAYPGGTEVCWEVVDANCDGVSGECWGGITGPNLFSSMTLWDMESPIGTGTVAGIVTVTGSVATSDCTTAETDTCSAKLQGPGSWTIESDLAAIAGDNMFCFASLLGSDASVPTTIDIYRGATMLTSVSHEAFSGGWTPTSEMGLVVPASAGTITMKVTLTGTDAVWIDAVDCQQ
jgi:hypothetical protein